MSKPCKSCEGGFPGETAHEILEGERREKALKIALNSFINSSYMNYFQGQNTGLIEIMGTRDVLYIDHISMTLYIPSFLTNDVELSFLLYFNISTQHTNTVIAFYFNRELIKELKRKALQIRKWVIESVYRAGSGHPGGSLSIADILACLYFHEMRHDPKNPKWPDRDRLVLSKGHAAPALYAALALAGYFPVEELKNLRKIGHFLQGHPCMKKVPGVDMSTGSLGQGLSVAVGMALAGKLDKRDYRVFAILGDGEVQEGQIWEAANAASHYKLDNLIAILDRNKLQIDGPTEEIMHVEPLAMRWKAFGWDVIEIDGHDIEEILDTFHEIKLNEKPTIIIAHTIKGKGVSFMEGTLSFHGKPPSHEQYIRAMSELEQEERELNG